MNLIPSFSNKPLTWERGWEQGYVKGRNVGRVFWANFLFSLRYLKSSNHNRYVRAYPENEVVCVRLFDVALRHKPVLFINLQGNKGPIPPRPISLRINSYGDNGDWVPDSFREK